MTTIEELLSRDGKLVYRTRGVSMEPMLRQNRDLVILQAPVSRLQKNDVALYRRGRDYVLHRVISVLSDGYLIRGDNTYSMENVPEEAILGVLTGFQRKGKDHSINERGYRLYVAFWNAIYPLRHDYVRLRRVTSRIVKKTGILSLLKKVIRHG